MFTRRRATAEELAQGEREMALSQKRLDEQLEKGEELQLEDDEAQKVSEEFKSPKAVRDDAKGSGERPIGTPKALHPQPPAQEPVQATQVTAEPNAAEASIVPASHSGTNLRRSL